MLSADDIQKLPTRGYRDAAAQQTGVVNFHRQIDAESQSQNTLIVRGGRPNEVAYYVDGFSQQDPLTGTSSTAINNDAIQEVVADDRRLQRRVRTDHVRRGQRHHPRRTRSLLRLARGGLRTP